MQRSQTSNIGGNGWQKMPMSGYGWNSMKLTIGGHGW